VLASSIADGALKPDRLRVPVRSVALMVCTRNRRELFGEWLSAAACLNAPPDCAFYIVVADNNDCSDEAWIRDAARTRGLDIIYRHESQTGYASARNAALEAALTTDAEVLIFVDDDDTPDPDLVVAHVEAFNEYRCDIVSGWIPARDKVMKEGRPAHLISTGNAAFRRWLVQGANLRFDSRYNRVGGEDSSFFRSALGLGASAVYARRPRVVTHSGSTPEAQKIAAAAWARNKVHIRSIRGGKAAAISKYVRSYVPSLFAGLVLIGTGRLFRASRLVKRGRELVAAHRYALTGLIHGGVERDALKRGDNVSVK
jgi:glycosyltransferase involved in cell wall biosynthesis